MGVICHLPGFASSLYFVITGLVYSLWCSHRSSKSEKRLALFFPTYSFRRFPPVGLKSDDAIDIERTSASLPIIPHCFPKTAFDTRCPPPRTASHSMRYFPVDEILFIHVQLTTALGPKHLGLGEPEGCLRIFLRPHQHHQHVPEQT